MLSLYFYRLHEIEDKAPRCCCVKVLIMSEFFLVDSKRKLFLYHFVHLFAQDSTTSLDSFMHAAAAEATGQKSETDNQFHDDIFLFVLVVACALML